MDRIALLTEVLAQNPTDAFARYGLALEYSNSGEVDRARDLAGAGGVDLERHAVVAKDLDDARVLEEGELLRADDTPDGGGRRARIDPLGDREEDRDDDSDRKQPSEPEPDPPPHPPTLSAVPVKGR